MGKILATFDLGITFREPDEPIEDGPESPEPPTNVELVALVEGALLAAGYLVNATSERTDR
jgi:hypothetical protein